MYSEKRRDAHDGLPAKKFNADAIDSEGRYLWYLNDVKEDGRSITAYVKERSPVMIAIGCDGCQNRHDKTQLLCSANFAEGAMRWLDDATIRPWDNNYFYLYRLKGHQRLDGLWTYVEIENDRRHTTAVVTIMRCD